MATREFVHAWDTLPVDHPMDKIDRRRVIGEKMMLSQVTLHEGFSLPTHTHENEQMAVVVSGRVRFVVDGEEMTLVGGQVLHLPPNVPHSAVAVETSVVLDCFSPPSEQTGVDAHADRS